MTIVNHDQIMLSIGILLKITLNIGKKSVWTFWLKVLIFFKESNPKDAGFRR